MNGLLTVKEIASKLKVCEETIARKLRTGELKGRKICGAWRVKESDFEGFINGQFGQSAESVNAEPSKK